MQDIFRSTKHFQSEACSHSKLSLSMLWPALRFPQGLWQTLKQQQKIIDNRVLSVCQQKHTCNVLRDTYLYWAQFKARFSCFYFDLAAGPTFGKSLMREYETTQIVMNLCKHNKGQTGAGCVVCRYVRRGGVTCPSRHGPSAFSLFITWSLVRSKLSRGSLSAW